MKNPNADQHKTINQNHSKKNSHESSKSQSSQNQGESESNSSTNQFIIFKRLAQSNRTQKNFQKRSFLNFSKKNSQQSQQHLKKLNIVNSMTNIDIIFFDVNSMTSSNRIFLKDSLSLTKKFQNLHIFSFFTISSQNNTIVEINSTYSRRMFRDFSSISENRSISKNKNIYHFESNDVFDDTSGIKNEIKKTH